MSRNMDDPFHFNTMGKVLERALQKSSRPPFNAVDHLEKMVETLVSKGVMRYEDAFAFVGSLPLYECFLLVPLRPAELDLAHLMSLVEVNERRGISHLTGDNLTDTVEVPQSAYLLVDVDNGERRRNRKPCANEEQILAKDRSPLTVYEGLIYCIVFPEVLANHNLDLCGSRYKSDGIPGIYLDEMNGNVPTLGVCWNAEAFPRWGAPSCRTRMVG